MITTPTIAQVSRIAQRLKKNVQKKDRTCGQVAILISSHHTSHNTSLTRNFFYLHIPFPKNMSIAAAAPTDAQLRKSIVNIMSAPNADFSKMSSKSIRAQLELEFECNSLKGRKKDIKAMVYDTLASISPESGDDDTTTSTKKTSRKNKKIMPKSKPVSKKRKRSQTSGGGGGGSGFTAPCSLSDSLCTFLSLPTGSHLARTQVVKKCWEHIKANELQNPQDRREIKLDADMKLVFGQDVETFTMFSMNRYLTQHIFKLDKIPDSDSDVSKSEQ